jgi:hypothetical protein
MIWPFGKSEIFLILGLDIISEIQKRFARRATRLEIERKAAAAADQKKAFRCIGVASA